MTMNAVDVAGVSFKYQKANVLQNISFSVPNQKIHALLGPSGSGKVKGSPQIIYQHFINNFSLSTDHSASADARPNSALLGNDHRLWQ